MGFLDKVKNMFTEEVEETVSKENDTVEFSEQDTQEEEKTEKVFPKKEEKVMPVFFDDQDFAILEKPKEERKVVSEEKYYNKKNEQPEKKGFKLSPVISPVYGVLDKNYHKEDITSKRSTPRVTYYEGENITIDDVRKKAYGTLEDEIESTLLKNEEPVIDSRMQRNYPNDVLLDDLMDPDFRFTKGDLEKRIISDEEAKTIEPFALDDFLKYNELDNDIDYKDPNEDTLTESDLFNLIDSMYDKEDE